MRTRRVCLEDWTFETCTLVQVRVICGRCELFPARFVLKISHNVSCRVVSDVLPKL